MKSISSLKAVKKKPRPSKQILSKRNFLGIRGYAYTNPLKISRNNLCMMSVEIHSKQYSLVFPHFVWLEASIKKVFPCVQAGILSPRKEISWQKI